MLWRNVLKKKPQKLYLNEESKLAKHYLSGEVYGFIVQFYDEDSETWEDTNDSCWGFYGDDWKKNGLLDNVSIEHYQRKDTEEMADHFEMIYC